MVKEYLTELALDVGKNRFQGKIDEHMLVLVYLNDPAQSEQFV